MEDGMMRVQVLGQDALERAQKMLSNIPGGIEKAARSAMFRTTPSIRSNSTKAIRERYDIKASDVRINEDVQVQYFYHNGIQATIHFSEKRIPLHRFGGASPKVPAQRVAAYGHQLNSTSPTRFYNAFVAQMKSGHIGMFKRTGKKNEKGRETIQEFTGSSVVQMLGSEQVVKKLEKIAEERFDKEFNHAVDAIIKGYY